MKILGLSAFYHDSAAVITIDGEIMAAAQEERFSRKKHDQSFPYESIRYCLKETGLTIDQLDAVAFYDKPLLKFERLLETYYSFAPKGILSFTKSMPVWLKQKMFVKKLIKQGLADIELFNKKDLKLLFPEHHLSHGASAYYPSPFDESAILTIDGVGEWATTSIFHAKKEEITVLKELKFPHSLGLLYSAFTYFLGFKVNSGEYKLMGLAPYGDQDSPDIEEYKNKIKEHLIDIKQDGSIWLNQEYFNYATGLKMIKESKWFRLFGFEKRNIDSDLEQHHCNLSLAIQQITEEIVLLMAKEAKRLTGAKNLCLAGGVALNCVANGKLQKAKIFDKIFIQPAAGDAGGALGCALAGEYIFFERKRKIHPSVLDSMKGSLLGPEFTHYEIEALAKKHNATFKKYEKFSNLVKEVAKHIKDGKTIGWFQGKMEFGPRALGARSILANPTRTDTQYKLNIKVKNRESFRPFAPSVLAEDCSKYFDYDGISPYMLLVHPINENIQDKLPESYSSLSLKEKLYLKKSIIPAVTHVDMSSRIQTVHKETNPKYYELLTAVKELTGLGMVANTSFNKRGEPIVCTPEDAYLCFMHTELDYLIVENFLFTKN